MILLSWKNKKGCALDDGMSFTREDFAQTILDQDLLLTEAA